MNGTIKYFVLKKYKGITKKHKSNTHLFFVPVDPKKYMYLALVGQLTEENNSYAAQLLVRFPEELLDSMIVGEIEYFKNRFVEVESLNCKSTNPSPGKYIIKPIKKGFNIISNLEINYQIEYSTEARKIYLINGNLNLVTGEISNQDMKMVAAKQDAFMGDKQRFEELKNMEKYGKIYYD